MPYRAFRTCWKWGWGSAPGGQHGGIPPGAVPPGEPEACAAGTVVQVFIERTSGRPVALPAALQVILSGILLEQQA